MKNILKKQSDIVFFTKESVLKEKGRYSIILSPQFYWVKKESLPVKRVYEARQLAESIFESSLPEGNFSYEVYKDGGEFIFIAYDKEEITSFLNERVLNISDISGVYFAQTEFKNLQDCTTIDDKGALTNINGLIVQVPRRCTNSTSDVISLLSSITLSSQKIKLGSYDQEFIDRKDFIFYAVLCSILILSLIFEYSAYRSDMNKIENQKDKIVKKYNLPKTSIQLKSIKNTLISTHKEQKKIRDIISGIDKLSLKKDEYIQKIELKKGLIKVLIKVDSKNRENEIKSMLSKSQKVSKTFFDKNILTVEIAL